MRNILVTVIGTILITINLALSKDIFTIVSNIDNPTEYESKVIQTLQSWGFNPILIGEENISQLNPSKVPMAIIVTDQKPSEVILDKLKNYVYQGGTVFTQFYGRLFIKYLFPNNVEANEVCWCPVVHNAYYFVKPKTQSILLKDFEIWDPPQPPNKESQLFWITKPGSYSCIRFEIIAKNENTFELPAYVLFDTTGWPYQDTNTEYCIQWGGCTPERTVKSVNILEGFKFGKGLIVTSSYISLGTMPNCNALEPYKIGPLSKILFSNLVNNAYNAITTANEEVNLKNCIISSSVENVPKGWSNLGVDCDITETQISDIFANTYIVWHWNNVSKHWEAWSPYDSVIQILKSKGINILYTIPKGDAVWILK